MGKNSKPGHPGAFILMLLFCVPFILYGLGILTAPVFVGALMLALFLLLLVVRFEVGFLIIIVMRSSLDYVKFLSSSAAADSGFNLAALISVALIVLGVFYVLFRKVDILQYEETAPFAFFLLITAASVFYSSDLKSSFSDWLRLVSVFSVYLLGRILFVTPDKVRTAFTAVLLSSLIPMAVACVQLVTHKGLVQDGEALRIAGTFLHPNAFASYILILLIFGISQWFEKKKMVAPFFLRAIVCVSSMIFIFTFSRGAWIAFVVAVLFLGVFRYRKLLVLLPLGLILVIGVVPSARARIENIFHPGGYARSRSAWAWREDAWKQILPLVYQKPILGHGLGTVETEFGFMTHNDYLRLAAETGILGLLAYLLLMGRLLGTTWKDFRRTRSERVRGLQMGLMALIVGFMVRQAADNTLRNIVGMIYFWLIVALIRNMSRFALLNPDFDIRPVITENGAHGDNKPLSNPERII